MVPHRSILFWILCFGLHWILMLHNILLLHISEKGTANGAGTVLSTRLIGRQHCHITSRSCGGPHNQSWPIQIVDDKAAVLRASWRLRGLQGNQCQNAWRWVKLALLIVRERTVWWTTHEQAACWLCRSLWLTHAPYWWMWSTSIWKMIS